MMFISKCDHFRCHKVTNLKFGLSFLEKKSAKYGLHSPKNVQYEYKLESVSTGILRAYTEEDINVLRLFKACKSGTFASCP